MKYAAFYSDDGVYILGIGKECHQGTEISESVYIDIQKAISNRPEAPEGYGYRLTADLEWELYELPASEDDPELTDTEVLEILLGGAT